VPEAAQKLPITLCMLTRNEEDRVTASLDAVRDHVERLVVLDADSDDNTRELAEACGAEVFVRPWEGFVSARRHLESLADTQWVFMIDADEVVLPDLWSELSGLGFPNCDADGFQMRRRLVYDGEILRRVFQPDWKMTLYRVDKGYFEDRAVHESIKIDGATQRLQAEILHYSYRSAADQYARIDAYAHLAAEDLARQGKRAGPLNLYLRPAWRWLSELFLMGAIVDGRLGVTMAGRSAYGVHLRYKYLRQIRAQEGR